MVMGPGLVEGWRREQVTTEKEQGDTTETEEQPNLEEEEAGQEWHPDRGNLNLELAAQYKMAQEQKKLEEAIEAAAQGRGRSCWQRGADTEEVGCSEGVRVECQAWRETTLIARGEMVVPRLRSRQRGAQEKTAEEVQIMATVVGAEEGCCTPGQKAREKGRHRTRGRSAAWEEEEGKGTASGRCAKGQRTVGEGGRGARG